MLASRTILHNNRQSQANAPLTYVVQTRGKSCPPIRRLPLLVKTPNSAVLHGEKCPFDAPHSRHIVQRMAPQLTSLEHDGAALSHDAVQVLRLPTDV